MKLHHLVLALLLACAGYFLSSFTQIGPAATPNMGENKAEQATGSSAEDFSYIDSLAMNAPSNINQDISAIASYLSKGCTTDIQKARAVFSWIANNIRYDDNAFNSGKYGSMEPTAILKRRHTVCEGYSNLYKALGEAMGLEVQVITGYAKAYGYRQGDKFTGTDTNHAWNAVKINGEWKLLDATWGAGHAEGGRGRLVSRKEFAPYWFNVDKYEFLFMHFPENTQWQLLPQTITLRQYEDIPLIWPDLFVFGFNAHDILDKALAKTLPKQLPEAYPTTHHVKLVDFPLTLVPTNEATFSVICNEDIEMAISNDLKQMPVIMKRSGNTYAATLPLKRGDLHVAIKGKSGSYSDIMLYKIK